MNVRSNMFSRLEKGVLKGNFREAENIFKQYQIEDISKEIIFEAFEQSSIAWYSFVNFLLVKKENADLHDLAIGLLINPLCHYEGAYFSALYHTRRSIELTESKDVGFLEYLLFLHDVPDKVVSTKEALEVCKQIEMLEPGNQIVKAFIKDNK